MTSRAALHHTSDTPEQSLTRLTNRQRQVVELVARGYTNHEIGAALHISANTIKKHLKLLFARLEVANRSELTALVSFHSSWLLDAAGHPG